MNGDGGIDTASYAGSAAGVTVNLTLATAQVSGGDASGDVLTGISNLIGSSAADVLIGNQAANQIIGGLGGDSNFGGNGADILDGGDGVDAVIYTYSSVGVVVNLLTNIQSGGEADGDNLSNIENITGSAYGDQITGNNLDNFLFGYHGDDILNGRMAEHLSSGGLGADTD